MSNDKHSHRFRIKDRSRGGNAALKRRIRLCSCGAWILLTTRLTRYKR